MCGGRGSNCSLNVLILGQESRLVVHKQLFLCYFKAGMWGLYICRLYGAIRVTLEISTALEDRVY